MDPAAPAPSSPLATSPDKHARDAAADSVERDAKRAKTAHDVASPLPQLAAAKPVSRVGSVDVKVEVETDAGSRGPTPSASRHASPALQEKPKKKPTSTASKAPVSASSSASAKKPKSAKEVKKPAAAVDKKKAKPKSRTLDELKSERARSTSTQPTTPGLDNESEDVYCICKGAVEEEEGGTMIGCEVCDNWFHPSCTGVAESEVDLLDVFICKDCEVKTSRRTVYKTLCKREGCGRNARSPSKFCSSQCAFQHAQGVLAGVDNKKARGQLQTALAAYPSPTPTVSVEHHGHVAEPAAPPNAEGELLAELRQQGDGVLRALELVAKRQAILEQAVAYYDSLVVTLAPAAPAPTKKSKNKRRDGQKEERPCAFDPRLLWDDEAVTVWSGEEAPVEEAPVEEEAEAGEGEGEGDDAAATPKPPSRAVCKNGRRCDRHQGWQRTTAVALEVEVAQLTRRRDELAAYAEGIEREADIDAAGAKARDEVHRRLVKA